MITASSTYNLKCEASRKASVKVNPSFAADAALAPVGRSPTSSRLVDLAGGAGRRPPLRAHGFLCGGPDRFVVAQVEGLTTTPRS